MSSKGRSDPNLFGGYNSSDTAVLLSLMYSTGKVSYEAKIKYLSYLLRGSKVRGKVTPPTIMISIQTIMAEEVQARYLPNNREAIDNLLALYSDGRKILCKRFSTKSRIALENRANSGLNPLFTESHGGQNGMRAGTA